MELYKNELQLIVDSIGLLPDVYNYGVSFSDLKKGNGKKKC